MLPFGDTINSVFNVAICVVVRFYMCSQVPHKNKILLHLSGFGRADESSSLPARMNVVCWQLKAQGEVEAAEAVGGFLGPLPFLLR